MKRLSSIFFLLVAVGLSGCGRGYVVDKKANIVIWETSDEGRGLVQTVITNADAATFQVFKLQGPPNFARDKNHVYLFGMAVKGAHPESFQRFPIPNEPHDPRGANFYYYRDSEHVFIYPFSLGQLISILPNSDPDSFSIITSGSPLDRLGWSRDKTRVYIFDEGFVPRDINSFEPLARGWARDNKAYYWFTNEITGADRNTFQITGSGAGNDNRFAYQIEEVWNTNHTVFQKVNLHRRPLK